MCPGRLMLEPESSTAVVRADRKRANARHVYKTSVASYENQGWVVESLSFKFPLE